LRDRRQWLEACAGCRGRLGPTGAPLGTCGLCALPFLCEIGVDAVKVVGREAAAYTKLRSVQLVRRVLEEVQAGAAPAECAALACTLRGTPEMCARGFSCYYRDLPEGARSSLHSERPLPVRD
jgi:putative protease